MALMISGETVFSSRWYDTSSGKNRTDDSMMECCTNNMGASVFVDTTGATLGHPHEDVGLHDMFLVKIDV